MTRSHVYSFSRNIFNPHKNLLKSSASCLLRNLSSGPGGPTKQTIDLLQHLFKKAPEPDAAATKEHNLKAMQKLASDEGSKALASRAAEKVSSSSSSSFEEVPLGIGETYKWATKFDRRSMWKQEPGSILYWYCMNMSFRKSDFERLLATPDKWSKPYSIEDFDFEVVRSRNPLNLTRWLGYYLIFPSIEAAKLYKTETQGQELGGLELKLRYVNKSAPGLQLSILEKVPRLPRNHCALILGLPDYITNTHLLRTLWDYDLLDDDDLALERLPKGLVKYGGSPVLVRFNNAQDAYRLMRQYHRQRFPNTDQEVLVEVLD